MAVSGNTVFTIIGAIAEIIKAIADLAGRDTAELAAELIAHPKMRTARVEAALKAINAAMPKDEDKPE